MASRKQKEMREEKVGVKTYPKGMHPVTYFLLPGSSSKSFYHIPRVAQI
jgi:hypothetical protein